MQKVTKIGFTVWFLCAFFYALEFIIRASGNSLSHSFAAAPYNLSPEHIGIFSSAFYWAYVAAQLPAGVLLDKFGIKKVMMFATFIFSVAIFIATQATSEEYLILYRILAGLGGGFAFLSALKAIAVWLPSRLFPMFTGATQMLMYTAGTLTGLPLVMLSNSYSIQTIMAGILVISIILFLCTVFFMKSKDDKEEKVHANTAQSSGVISVLKNKQIWLNGLFCFTIYGTTALFADLWSFRFLSIEGYSEYYAGVASSMIFVGIAVFSPLWGFVATILNKEKILLVGASVVGLVIVTVIVYFNPSPIMMCALCVLWGGMQAVHVLNFTILRTQVHPKLMATGLALVNLFIPLSGAILQPFVGVAVTTLNKQGYSDIQSFKIALFILPILMFLSLVLALFIKEKKD